MNDYIKREEALSALCDPCAYKSACYSGDEIPACPALWTMLNIPAADVVERKNRESVLRLRSQAERMTIAETLLDRIWEEMTNGCVQDGLLQLAVNCQILCNRIVWKLNVLNEEVT